MKRRKILGIMVVMATLMTAIPMMAGQMKAANSNTEHVPSYLVVVRKGYDDVGGYTINATIGNAYQDDRFGVEVIVRVVSYTYDPSSYDIVKLNITGIGVKGDNAGDYKVKWF